MPKTTIESVTYRRYRSKAATGALYRGDALVFLSRLPASSAGVVFLDPPFNLGKRYSEVHPKIDARPPADYTNWMREVIDASVRVMAPGASLFLYHLPTWAIVFGEYLHSKLDFRHWIAVSMKNGFVRGQRLYPAHYALLYYTKGIPAHFRRPRLQMTTCRNCGEPIRDYGGYRSIVEKKGVNLSDVWDDLSPVRHSTTKLGSQNQLPIKMLRRVLDIAGAPGTTYVDPFAGTGTGVIAAIEAGMPFEACDILQVNCELIAQRIRTHSVSTEKRGNGNRR